MSVFVDGRYSPKAMLNAFLEARVLEDFVLYEGRVQREYIESLNKMSTMMSQLVLSPAVR